MHLHLEAEWTQSRWPVERQRGPSLSHRRRGNCRLEAAGCGRGVYVKGILSLERSLEACLPAHDHVGTQRDRSTARAIRICEICSELLRRKTADYARRFAN